MRGQLSCTWWTLILDDFYTLPQDLELHGKPSTPGIYPQIKSTRYPQTPLLLPAGRGRLPEEEIDQQKGIMLRGRVGCGKTSVMNIMLTCCAESFIRMMMFCRTVSLTLTKKGPDVIDHFVSCLSSRIPACRGSSVLTTWNWNH